MWSGVIVVWNTDKDQSVFVFYGVTMQPRSETALRAKFALRSEFNAQSLTSKQTFTSSAVSVRGARHTLYWPSIHNILH